MEAGAEIGFQRPLAGVVLDRLQAGVRSERRKNAAGWDSSPDFPAFSELPRPYPKHPLLQDDVFPLPQPAMDTPQDSRPSRFDENSRPWKCCCQPSTRVPR